MITDVNELIAAHNYYQQRQGDIAKEMHVDRAQYNRVMKGHEKPGPTMITKMNQWLEIKDK